MQRLEGVVQHYAWGDTEFIPQWLGIEPDGRPWAELWFGTHATGHARLEDGSPLASITGELPYLLKILASADPLSLQTHPNAEQAKDGFDRGIYPDANAKPELLVALTPFELLCGIRPLSATLRLLDDLEIDELARVLSADGPAATLAGLYHGDIALGPIIDACRSSSLPEAVWVSRLADGHPGQASPAVTLLLNHVVLTPGQAVRLDAGNLHSYLHGAGIELMGPSDNVVRGGLTEKPVDVDQLLEIVDPTPLESPVLPVSERYELSAAGVALVRLDLGQVHVATSHELAIDLNGSAWYYAPGEQIEVGVDTYVVVSL